MPPFQPSFKPTCNPGLSQLVNTEAFRRQIYTDQNSQRLRWFEAFSDPTFNQDTGEADTKSGHAAMSYCEREDTRHFRALVVPANRGNERHFPQGSLTTGSILVHSMPDELPLSQHDIIVPIGQSDTNGIPNGAWDIGKETIIRGSGPRLLGAGLVSVAGASVTGTGTVFTQFVRPGDILFVLDEPVLVASVTSDTALVLAAAPEQSANLCQFSKATDALRNPIAFAVDQVRLGAGIVAQGNYELSPSGESLIWKSAASAPPYLGKYAVRYRYFPRYIIRDDLGVRPPPVNGQFLPQTMVAERMGGTIQP